MNRPKLRRCPKCKRKTLMETPVSWECPFCKYKQQRFIHPFNTHPLFLNVEAKNEETKKFLEDIMQKPEKPKRKFYISEFNPNMVFVQQGKRLEAYTIAEFCKMLAKEIKENE